MYSKKIKKVGSYLKQELMYITTGFFNNDL